MIGRPTLRLVLSAGVLAAMTVVVLAQGAQPAAAAPALVQTGSVVTVASGSSITLTLPSASTAGNLLVAVVSEYGNSNTLSGPGGSWQTALSGSGGSTVRRSGIFYYPNNAGGVTSAVFTSTAGTYLAGQLMEWSGIGTTSPLDVCDRAGNTSATTSLTVNSGGSNCASGSTGYSNELAISTFQEHLGTAGTVTFTPGAGWTNAGNTGASSVSMQYTSDYETGVALNTAISETQTSSVASDLNGGWEGILVTFAPPPTCTGGSLTLSAASVQFNSTTLNGKDKTVTTSNNPPVFTPSDQRGTGAGWNITLTSTQFTVSGHTLPTTATTLTSVQDSADAGTCSVPTNSVTYPVTVPAGAGPPAAIKIYNAALNTGQGDSQLTLNFSLALPASAYVGSYTSTWTFSIVTGP